VARDPQIRASGFSSSEAAFMLVPSVDPAKVVYAAAPSRRLTIEGTRLIPTGAGGETMVGRSTVPRSAYLSETPIKIVVPVPATLPTRAVNVQVGTALSVDPVAIGGGPHVLHIVIGGTSVTQSRTISPQPDRSEVAAIVEGMIHDAAPTIAPNTLDPRFTEARVTLWQDRLIVVPGDLTSTVAIDTPAAPDFAGALGLTGGPPLLGITNAYVSGVLGSPPPLSSPVPRVQLTIGATTVVLDVARASSLDGLALDLQTRINAMAGQAFTDAIVATIDGQLLFIPGTADVIAFDAVPGGDDRTVVELQLHARFSVRVRVNGAESIDPAVVELPQ
jgi:hypothetical protein